MSWTIEIDYITGDSFGSENRIQTVGLAWENLDIAKENLQRIKAHYQYYCSIRLAYLKAAVNQIVNLAAKEPWFSEYDYCMLLKLDNGTEHVYHTFWCGYFERLNRAKIIPVFESDSDMEIWV